MHPRSRLSRRVALAASLVALPLAGACRGAPSPAAPPAAEPTTPPASGASAGVPRAAMSLRAPVRLRAGDLHPDTLHRVASRVVAIVATPAELRVAVGDTLWIDDAIEIAALDGAGHRLGRLPIFDRGLQPGAAVLVRDDLRGTGISGLAVGDGVLRVHFPRFAWTGDPMARPTLDVRVVVGGA